MSETVQRSPNRVKRIATPQSLVRASPARLRGRRLRWLVDDRNRLGDADMMLAHDETGLAEGLFAGLLHPVTGLDHVVAMVAVGLWGAQLGRPAIYLLPIAFPVVMALGGFVGLAGHD